MQKLFPASWGTTAQASRWTLTPTSPGRCRRMPPRGWAASSPSKRSKRSGEKEGVPEYTARYALENFPYGSCLGQNRKTQNPEEQNRTKSKKISRFHRKSGDFQSERRDLNLRPLGPEDSSENPTGAYGPIWCRLLRKCLFSKPLRSNVSVRSRRGLGQRLGQPFKMLRQAVCSAGMSWSSVFHTERTSIEP